jgi:hypothetical protein
MNHAHVADMYGAYSQSALDPTTGPFMIWVLEILITNDCLDKQFRHSVHFQNQAQQVFIKISNKCSIPLDINERWGYNLIRIGSSIYILIDYSFIHT